MPCVRPRSVLALLPALIGAVALAGANLLLDPGFERYRYHSELGYYVPAATAVWTEYGYGAGSVRFDAGGWAAPAEMTRQAPLGFSPGGGGYTGSAPGQNRGTLYLRQDLVGLNNVVQGQDYEAWVWLGGAGRDDNQLGELDGTEERGGWRILWYSNTDTANWREDNVLAVHKAELEHYGPANSFVLVYGSGLTPFGAVGMRFEAFAFSWVGDPPWYEVDTRVAIDNAYYGRVNHNLVRSGNFEEDVEPGDFVGWRHPDPWWGIADTLPPYNQLMPVGYEYLLPYKPRARAYGLDVHFQGWVDGAFTFGQQIDVSAYPDGSEFALTFYWHQNSRNPHEADILRRPMARAYAGVECKAADARVLQTIRETVVWPVSGNPANTSPYDTNDNLAYNHRVPIRPPAGTAALDIHMVLETNADPWPGKALWLHCIDDVFLRVVSTPTPIPPDPSLLELH